ncbi:hypothetical protein EMPS_11634 [Entomortierella parvispora]|uniref:Uncharacterized protein n=1 Tax=Entomortierella parvispora TaxID=205924 RepID=A0A9P3HN47_9FUNG|nr:hypothetical protein EMPS_11634 [Entomortierella parvispora]
MALFAIRCRTNKEKKRPHGVQVPPVSVQQIIGMMAFVNDNWGNPLRRVDQHGNVVLENVPVALRGLYWSDFRYLCRVMTFSSLSLQSLVSPCLFHASVDMS